MAVPDTYTTAVENLQTYLRQLSYDTPGMTQPPINGVFGVATRRALEEFQASRGLRVTGQANQPTWESLYSAYRHSLKINAPGQKMDIFPRHPDNARVELGSRGFVVAAIQFMLARLEEQYGEIGNVPITGEFDKTTETAVKTFQKHNTFAPNGVVTGEIWDSMTSQYNVLFSRPLHH